MLRCRCRWRNCATLPSYRAWTWRHHRCCTAWVPLQDTPFEMGPLAFAPRSHRFEHGRDLEISDEEDFFALNMEDPNPGPPDQFAIRRDQAQIERCMKDLDGDQLQTISLAFFHGLSHSEVADHLGRPLGTVKTHIRRGLMKLKGCLES